MSLNKKIEDWFHEDNGITTFRSSKPGPARVISGVIHGDETGGGKIVTNLRDKLKLGELTIDNGSVTLIAGNERAVYEGTRSSKNGYNLNRLFGFPDGLPKEHAANGTYEAERAKEIEAELISLNPTEVYDLHETIRASEPMAIHTLPISRVTNHQLAKLVRMGIKHLITSDIETGTVFHTFEGMCLQKYGAESYTLELGQIGSPENIARFVQMELERIISGKEANVEAEASKLNIWKMTESPIKLSTNFRFTMEGLINFSKLATAPLPYAEDITKDGNSVLFVSPNNGHIIFPNPNVEIGERTGIVIVPITR